MIRLTAAVLCLLTAPVAARADIVLTFEQTNPSRDLRFTAGTRVFEIMPTGTMVFTGSPSATAAGFDATVRAYCVDLFRDVAPAGTPASYDVTQPANLGVIAASGEAAVKQAYLTELWGRHAASTSTPDGAAAFALSVWKLVYDPVANRSDLGSGFIRFAPADVTPAVTLAANWLAGLSGDTTQFTNNPLYAGQQLVGLDSKFYQDQITVQPVPAPAGVLLALFGAAALVVRRVRG